MRTGNKVIQLGVSGPAEYIDRAAAANPAVKLIVERVRACCGHEAAEHALNFVLRRVTVPDMGPGSMWTQSDVESVVGASGTLYAVLSEESRAMDFNLARNKRLQELFLLMERQPFFSDGTVLAARFAAYLVARVIRLTDPYKDFFLDLEDLVLPAAGSDFGEPIDREIVD